MVNVPKIIEANIFVQCLQTSHVIQVGMTLDKPPNSLSRVVLLEKRYWIGEFTLGSISYS